MSWSASRLIRVAPPYLNWDKYSPQAMPVRCRRTSFCQLQCKFNIDNDLATNLRNGFINVARLLDAIGSRQAAIKNLGNAANGIYIVSAFRLFFRACLLLLLVTHQCEQVVAHHLPQQFLFQF